MYMCCMVQLLPNEIDVLATVKSSSSPSSNAVDTTLDIIWMVSSEGGMVVMLQLYSKKPSSRTLAYEIT